MIVIFKYLENIHVEEDRGTGASIQGYMSDVMQGAKACIILFQLIAIQGGSYYLYLSDDKLRYRELKEFSQGPKLTSIFTKIHYFALACIFLVSCAYCTHG